MTLITKKQIDECRKHISIRNCADCLFCDTDEHEFNNSCYATWVYVGNGKEPAGTYIGNHTVLDF